MNFFFLNTHPFKIQIAHGIQTESITFILAKSFCTIHFTFENKSFVFYSQHTYCVQNICIVAFFGGYKCLHLTRANFYVYAYKRKNA